MTAIGVQLRRSTYDYGAPLFAYFKPCSLVKIDRAIDRLALIMDGAEYCVSISDKCFGGREVKYSTAAAELRVSYMNLRDGTATVSGVRLREF